MLLADEVVDHDCQILDNNVDIILVKRSSTPGAFRVTGPGRPRDIPNVVTGPKESGIVVLLLSTSPCHINEPEERCT